MKKEDSQYAQLQKKYFHFKKEILVGVSTVIILLIAGGIAVVNLNLFGGEEITYEKFVGKDGGFEGGKFAQEEIICNPPYIYYGTKCCLDQNDNNICDSNERGELGVSAPPVTGTSLPTTALPPEAEAEFVGGRLVCNSPYIRHEAGCCLDQNENRICDRDEGREATPVGEIPSDADGITPGTSMPAGTAASAATTSAETISNETLTEAPSEASEEVPPGEIPLTPSETPAETEMELIPTTETSCTDRIDNDEDGLVDTIDSDCRGQTCSTKWSYVWVWSYLPHEDQSAAPPANAAGQRRIGCCHASQCRNITSQCVDYDAYYTDKWICGGNNNWDQCTAGEVGTTSDGGAYYCGGKPPRWYEIFHSEGILILCGDDLDNDLDGYIDERDSDCEGIFCGIVADTIPQRTKVWVWSKLPPYDEADPPARIACCESNRCVNSEGNCINYDTHYITSNGNKEFICGDDNDWDRCGPLFDPLYNKFPAEPAWEYSISDGGNYECMGNDHPDVWVRR